MFVDTCIEAAELLHCSMERLEKIVMWIALAWGPEELKQGPPVFDETTSEKIRDLMQRIEKQLGQARSMKHNLPLFKFLVRDARRRLTRVPKFEQTIQQKLAQAKTKAITRGSIPTSNDSIPSTRQPASSVARPIPILKLPDHSQNTLDASSSQTTEDVTRKRSCVRWTDDTIEQTAKKQHRESTSIDGKGSNSKSIAGTQSTNSTPSSDAWQMSKMVFNFIRQNPQGLATFPLAEIFDEGSLNSPETLLNKAGWDRVVYLIQEQMPFDSASEALWCNFPSGTEEDIVVRAINAASFNSALRLAKNAGKTYLGFTVAARTWSHTQPGASSSSPISMW